MRLIWAFSVYKTTTAPQCVWAVMRTKGRAWDYEGERQWRPCPWLNNRTRVVESGKLVKGCTHDQLCGRRWHCLYCRPASGATASVPGCCNHSIGCSDLVLVFCSPEWVFLRSLSGQQCGYVSLYIPLWVLSADKSSVHMCWQYFWVHTHLMVRFDNETIFIKARITCKFLMLDT